MRAGQMRHRIVIQSASETTTVEGDVTQSWSTSATKWASIRPLNSKERVQAGQIQGDVTHEIRWRFDPNITTTTANRITHESRVFQIVGIYQTWENRREMVAMCREQI